MVCNICGGAENICTSTYYLISVIYYIQTNHNNHNSKSTQPMYDNAEIFKKLCSSDKQLIIHCTTDCDNDYSIQYMGIKVIFPLESSFVKLKQFKDKTFLVKDYDFNLENSSIKVNKFEIL